MAVTLILSPDSNNKHIGGVAAMAARMGLDPVKHPSPHAMILRGTTNQMRKVFDVDLRKHHTPQGTFRCRKGPVSVPASFGSRVVAVLGLDTRPQAKPHYHRRARAGAFNGYTAPLIANAYGLPAHRGKGHSVGIIELGGAYSEQAAAWYFSKAGLNRTPNITTTGKQRPGQHDASVEVMLDAEIVASLVPAAETVIYFAPNTTAGFYNALSRAIRGNHDAISASWGAPEDQWTPASMEAINALAQTATGITITAASGDAGSSDGEAGTHVDFPASAPYILGCGGTTLTLADNAYGSESVWNDGFGGASGGGYSSQFALPDYQAAINLEGITFRIVPDVAADGDPATGWMVRVNGVTEAIGGTSASAPLWAALVCRLNAILNRRLGFIHNNLYALDGALHDVTVGNNGAYNAAAGYDCCTGIGTPSPSLLASLQSQ
jgi:kumamolisin